MIRTVCERTGAEVMEANACPDHTHLPVNIPPKMPGSRFMGILKGKTSLMIFDRFASLKDKYGNRYFRCRGYCVDTVGRHKTGIAKYIRKQSEGDQIAEPMSMKEYLNPFTGAPTGGFRVFCQRDFCDEVSDF